jgi:valyl-tRNA synthetase
MTANPELGKTYEPGAIEPAISNLWLERKAFAAAPDQRERRYVIMMPLPNVTGALHMGHAMDGVMQDLLIRWHRMLGDNALWMAGTDHAGIATQAVVERRLFELEQKTRHDVGRDELVRRIWLWKDHYAERIVQQQQAMGASCDWDRARFTMDAVCARAVREAFFRMFADGLIFQGVRLVNWDCHLQTAVADDELYKQTVAGHFWHLRYPIVAPQAGEPVHLTVATTRPETMLGDTAVAVHPDPRGALAEAIGRARTKLAGAPAREREQAQAELDALLERERTHLPRLEQLARMALAGRKVRLPLQEREIPLILDPWAKPELGSGCVKITPAHDPNDYEVWTRHQDRIAIVNVLHQDGRMNEHAGRFAGLDRFVARERVVEALAEQGLLERVEERQIEIDHSDRSKTIVEPYLSRQWFVRMGDVPGGVRLGRGSGREFHASGLAQAAIDSAMPGWRSPSGRSLRFHPDERYQRTFVAWLAEKRDWCISRQLWWGHRIPVFHGRFPAARLLSLEGTLQPFAAHADVAAWVLLPDGRRLDPLAAIAALRAAPAGDVEVQVCCRTQELEARLAPLLRGAGLVEDPDVLDTWFSSGIWPFSTLGWPDPETAPVDPGQTPLGSVGDAPDCLAYYYPGSCLATGRDIITLWVARMVVLGLYCLGDVPFTDVFLHANIQDGKGERMSKSKGNGVDPMDMIERYGADAMRYVLCEMQTGTQDIRLPVQAISPFTGELVDLATAKPGRFQGTYVDPRTGQEFDVAGMFGEAGIPGAKTVSERFEVGRNFCNKLWNAGRFALMNLEGGAWRPLDRSRLAPEDRWILSRVADATATATRWLEQYNPSAALNALRELFWSELCDWYLELIKPRLRDPEQAPIGKQVLATALDHVLRLLHPFVPFVTEALWQRLESVAPVRGVEEPLPSRPLLVHAPWPRARADWRDPAIEAELKLVQETVTALREVRARYAVPPRHKLAVLARAQGGSAEALRRASALIRALADVEPFSVDADAARSRDAASALVRDVELLVRGVVDAAKERAKLAQQRERLEAQLRGIAQKLDNPGFVAKAPPDVVARERERLAEFAAQAQQIAAALAALERA